MELYYPLLPIGIGLLSLAWLVRDIVAAWLLGRRGDRAEGEIVGYAETMRTSRVIVRFRTEDGEEVLTTNENSSWSAARYGDPVTVSYDPDDPRRARIVAAPWPSLWPRTLFVSLASGILLIGCLLGVLTWW
ncbi:DUF3592 domain-containing protein [Thermobifida cellulosilytica]|uniref:DUF3592 domain-containing protein n=1 Tax=Thermobifida cellulosilytica TB100 TaxID=665004 RepID=A0A147KEI9_THECS|nr:DUF3592 domain-containing protein [Thermobifida cellulosilytica]KUP95726.1 hypothetical protein AC529_16015 [Thermobifida cellulosilytica TB100]